MDLIISLFNSKNQYKTLYIILFSMFLVSCGKTENTVRYDTYPVNSSGKEVWQEISIGQAKTIHIPDSLAVDYRNAIENAGQRWNNALGFTAFVFVYDNVENKEPTVFSPKPSLYFTLRDNVLAFYKQNTWNFEEESSQFTLASTVSLTRNSYIIEADILFNFKHYIFADVDNPPSNNNYIDMESVMVHELGHFLGLGHVDYNLDPTSVMNTTISKASKKRDLSLGDITRIKELYLK